MKNFREAYKETVDSIPVPGFRTEEISEKNQKKRLLPYRRKRYMAAAALAGGIFVIYTLGGVAAGGYARSLIRVDENGFQTMDIATALLQEEIEEQTPAQNTSPEESGVATLAETGGTSVETADNGIMGRMVDDVDSAGAPDAAVLEDLETSIEQADSQAQKMSEYCEKQERIYASYEAFTEEHEIPLALPNESLPGELIQEEYILMEDSFLLVRLETEESVLLMHQAYYGNALAHAFSMSYPDGVCNERTYTTLQGAAYKLVDSPDGNTIHAAVAVGGYELFLDFLGYTEQEVHEVLEDMDLSVYH